MKRNITIRLKAGFLATIFSLNIVIGFACAIGLDMGFNVHHHHEEAVEETRQENSIKKGHIHEAKHHDEQDEEKDGCCNNKVSQLTQLDKVVPAIFTITSSSYVITSVFYPTSTLYPSQVNPNGKYFVLGHHPPIPDIRIAIRSFQI